MANEPPQAARTRAYSYVRMSTDLQLKGDSRRRQMELSRRYALDNNLDLDESFRIEDLGVSALRGDNVLTGNLGVFLAEVNAGRVRRGSYLLVESLDRLSRQQVLNSLILLINLLQNGIVVVTLSDNRKYDGDIDERDLIYSLMVMSRAHEESSTKGRRLSAVWEHKRRSAANLKMTARCPAWLRLSPDKRGFEPITDRVAVIVRIFEEAADGVGSYAIANRLNRDGVPTFGSSAGWQVSYVTKILKNRAVIGAFQPRKTVGGVSLPEGPELIDYFPGVVPEALFHEAQRGRSRRRSGAGGRRGKNLSNLFTGVAKCGYCGAAMHFENKGVGPKGNTYLVCDKARRGLGCCRVRWRYDQFENLFLSYVSEIDLRSVFETLPRNDEVSAIRVREANLLARIEIIEQERGRLVGLYIKLGGDDTYVAAELAKRQTALLELTEELAGLRLRLEALDRERIEATQSASEIAELVSKIRAGAQEDGYRLRTRLAARITQVAALRLYVQGKVPFIDRELAHLEMYEEVLDDEKESERLRLERLDATKQRPYFVVEFRSGESRVVSTRDGQDVFWYVVSDPEFIEEYHHGYIGFLEERRDDIMAGGDGDI